MDDLIVVNASGEGTALVQIAWLYNVQVVPEQPAFELKVNTKSSAGALKVIVCTRWGIQQIFWIGLNFEVSIDRTITAALLCWHDIVISSAKKEPDEREIDQIRTPK